MKNEAFWVLLGITLILLLLVVALPNKAGHGLLPLALIALAVSWFMNPGRRSARRKAHEIQMGIAVAQEPQDETPQTRAQHLYARFADEIAMMVMLARADGRLTADERAHITDTIIRRDQAKGICRPTLDDLVKGVRSGDAKFRQTIDRLARTRNAEHLAYFYQHSKAMLEASGGTDPICMGNLQYCRQKFKIGD